jgi:peptidoglycan/xylan/chitin deacetylase (PgdA/CDA1 family)
LPAHDPVRQLEEIQGAKAQLEALVGSEVTSFSYPYGSQSPKTVEIVRRSGFALGCRAAPGRVEYGSDPLQLPRFEVRNWTGDAFASRLEAWLGGRPDAPAPETR